MVASIGLLQKTIRKFMKEQKMKKYTLTMTLNRTIKNNILNGYL